MKNASRCNDRFFLFFLPRAPAASTCYTVVCSRLPATVLTETHRDPAARDERAGTDIFKLPGERIHRIMGVTRCDSSPEEVLNFFSDPKNFTKHFTILDDMFKGGGVIKIGGDGLELDATGSRQRQHQLGNFAALSIGGKDRSGPTDPNDLADGAIGYFSKLRRSGAGKKIEAWVRRRADRPGVSVASDAIASLPSSQDAAMEATLTASAALPSETAERVGGGQFKDRPGHALLHGMFKLPSVIPDRDFIWDQVALRLPTGSVLIAGRSVDDDAVDAAAVTCPKGHVRGAVLTSGYYIVPDADRGCGSRIHFVVQADPKGSLPAWAVNLVAPKQAHNVTRLRNYLDGAKEA